MNAQVSLGSQPQYRPQALSAQMAPAMTAKVQIGKPKTAVRWATRSRVTAPGSRERNDPSAVGAGRRGGRGAARTPPRPAAPCGDQLARRAPAERQLRGERDDGDR